MYQLCYVKIFSTSHYKNLLLLDDPGRVRSQITNVVGQIQRFDFDCNMVMTRKVIIRIPPGLRSFARNGRLRCLRLGSPAYLLNLVPPSVTEHQCPGGAGGPTCTYPPELRNMVPGISEITAGITAELQRDRVQTNRDFSVPI